MVKQRKERIGGEFIGFSAFAAPAEAPPQQQSWSPVYTGQHDGFRSLFSRLSQKSDCRTLCTALQDLSTLFEEKDLHRRVQIDALFHWAWLYHTKLGPVDANSTVRAGAFSVWVIANGRIPKAVASICQRYPELLGMLYSAKADPSSEVRNAAAGTSLLEDNDWPWWEGITAYTTRILSYGRPSGMDSALFPKRTGDPDRDQMEERFDRLVGNCLDVLIIWMRDHPCLEANDVWWKTFGSSKATLRRKTYQLAASIAAASPTLANGLREHFPPAFSSEKEANNMPALLEALLTVLVKGDTPVDAPLIKSLVKVFRKACYQASVDQWGPMLLPIVAKLDNLDQQRQILKANQDGVEATVNDADKWRLWTAICESAHVCGRADVSFNEIWLGGLHFALTNESFHRTARGPRNKFLEALAGQLVQKSLDESCLDVMSSCPISMLTDFVSVLLKTKPFLKIPKLKQRFHFVIGEFQNNSGASPSRDAYLFISTTLKYLGPDEIFDPAAIRSFVMNDLLRWAVLHTSSLSEHRAEDPEAVIFDFEVLAQCLGHVSQSNLWGPFLREVLAAKADLLQLTKGLESLVASTGNEILLVQSELLDSFTLELASNSATQCDDEASKSLQERSEVAFFRCCLSERKGKSIASAELIDNLVGTITIGGIENCSSSILDAFSEEIAIDRTNRFSESLVLKVAIAAWFATRNSCILSRLDVTFEKSEKLRTSFTKACASRLRNDLSTAKFGNELSNWSIRCVSLWNCCTKWGETLPPIGLECLSSWESNTETLYQALLCILKDVEESSNQIDVIRRIAVNADTHPFVFLSKILPLLSDAGPNILGSAKARLRMDRAACLLNELFGSDQLRENGLAIAKELILGLSEVLTFKRVAVLSQLFTMLLPRASDPDPDEISCEKVAENTQLWYLPDEDNPNIRMPATVKKVHHDVISGFYFTIIVESREKQTLANRLRTSESYSDSVKVTHKARKELRPLMITVISRHATTTEQSFGDFVSVLIQQIGLGPEKGIGSARFEVLKIISSFLDRCLAEISSTTLLRCTELLFQSALLLGFGFSVPQHLESPDYQSLSVTPLANTLLTKISDTKYPELHVKLLPFLVAILPLTKQADTNSNTFTKCLHILFSEVTALFSSNQSPEAFLLGCKVILSGVSQINEVTDASVLPETCFSEAFNALLDVYFTPENTIRESIKQKRDLIPEFDDMLNSLPRSKLLRSLWSKVVREKSSIICQCLLHTDEYYSMYLLLKACTIEGVPLRDDENTALTKAAEEMLSLWIDGMSEEEAAEVEVDMDICLKWIPEELLLRLEHWDDEEDFNQISRNLIIEGSFLWLSFLNFAQTAIPTEYRVRPAFASFLDRSGALNHALNLIVLYDGWVENVDENTIVDLFDIERKTLNPSELVSSVIFRTMTVFPSLTKRWWEENCPKVYIRPIQRFVENVVSPEMLRQELKQIRSDSAFGEMVVSASLVSRQVIATYVQDEFKLKVIITVPKSFPLRSAEVDCSQTLGVPESRWKRWSLQIRQMLNNQGGTLRDALTMWKDNVDKEFEGVEPCPVCYSVLHVKTHKLPSLECSTCHNRFHFDCLTQWFRSSGKNQCVLCQQQWRGTRV